MKFRNILFIASSLFLFACTKEVVTDNDNGCELVETSFTAQCTDADKTSLDGTHIKWTEGEEISVLSTAAGNQRFISSGVSPDGSTATFQGLSSKEGPWYAVYPYDAAVSYKSSGPEAVVLPVTQNAVAGSFGNKANVAVAYAANAGDELTFINIGALLSFTVNESDINKIVITSENTLAGTADVNWNKANPTLSFNNASKSVTLTGSFTKGERYYAVVAPGTLLNPKFRFEKNGYYAELSSTGSKALARNGNYYIGSFSVPSAKWVAKKGISTPDDLLDFASRINSGSSIATYQDSDGSVKLLADIDMTGQTWTPIGTTSGTSLSYNSAVAPSSPCTNLVFDGDGHTISNLTMTADIQAGQVGGMFGATKGGTIKNLILANAKMTIKCATSGIHSNNAAVGLLVGYCYNTNVLNVKVKGTLTGSATSSKDRHVSLGGIIGYLNNSAATNIKDCVFDGNITPDIGSKYTNTNTAVVGGIVASISANCNSLNYIDRCIVNGGINAKVHKSGGIVANAYKSRITNCVNNASVTTVFSAKMTGNVTGVRSGGILGTVTITGSNASYVENCTNTGTISSTENDSAVGGIAGLTKSYTITGCTNKGDIYCPGTQRGLLVGLVSPANDGYKTEFKNCYVRGRTGTSEGAGDVVESTAANYMTYAAVFLEGADQTTYTTDNIKYIVEEKTGSSGIASARDLQDFAQAVSAGQSISPWQDGEYIVNILNDIDCSSITDWTPIGNDAHPFTGHFRGNGYTISNLKMTFTNSVEGPAYGLFGNVGAGAIIEDFTLAANCSATMHPSVPVRFGAVIGYAVDANIKNITNYAPVTFSESQITATSTLSAIGGIAGAVQTSAAPMTASFLVNNGEINVTELVNTGSGSTCVYTGGIIGRVSGKSDANRMTVINCTNNGDINGTVCRIAGICGGPGTNTTIESCTNNGKVVNNHHISGAGRPAGILCHLDDGAKLIKCANYGDIISASADRVGGVCCNASSSTRTLIQECDNYGRVISDSQYRGTFFGYCHGATPISSCVARGDLGTYNSGNYQMVGVNAENYFGYSGYYTAAATYATTENILWSREATPASETFGPNITATGFTALAETPKSVKMSSKYEDWTSSVSASWIHLKDNNGDNVTSGTASDIAANLVLSADWNVTTASRSGTVTFTSATSGTVAKISVSQNASTAGMPSVWMFNETTEGQYSSLWVNNGLATATNGGSAVISVVRGSGSTIPFTYSMSGARCLVSNIIKDDYYLFTVPTGNLPVGTYIQFDTKLVPKNGSKAHKYFIAEIYDGDSWKSVPNDLRTAPENSSLKYTARLVYDKSTYQYACVYQIFKLTNAVTSGTLKIRMRAVGDYTIAGATESVGNTGAEIGLAQDEYVGGVVRNLGTAAPSAQKKVLWLGNSFTYYFSAPIKLEELAFSQGKQVDINAHVRGSQTFENHCNLEQSLEEINVGSYDFAFIQDQSTRPSDYGKDPTTYSYVKTWAKTLSDKIKAKSPSCKVIQEATWSFSKNNYNNYGSYSAFDTYMNKGVKEITTYCGNWMSPINDAFAQVRSQYPSYVLLFSDNKHQSDLGAYIVACVNYLVIFGEKFDSNASNCGIDPTQAANIRKICEDVVIGNESKYNIVR